MARPSAIATLLLLVISLLAVTHCHTVAVAADHAAVAVAVSDENGLSSNPTLAAESGASAIIDEDALPAEQQHGFEFLRVPSYHPCRLHRHPLWKPHHRIYTRDPACMFDDYDHYSGHDGERREAVSHLDILPGAEARETEKVKPVAEPDPDRSLPDSDGEGELVASREPSSFASADTDGHDGEPWKEMLRRWLRYAYFHFHHGTRCHSLHLKQEEEATPETESMNMKPFHFHHHDEEDEEKNMMRKRLRHGEHDHNEDSDDEDEEVEEMVRRFRKAFMRIRRRFGHDAEHGGNELSRAIAWIKGLMNRF